MQEYYKVDLSKYSNIEASFSVNEDNTIILAKFSGLYKKGSLGNGDGTFMFSTLVSYYFMVEPITIILDLEDLEYEWGNRIIKAINFFSEIGRDDDERAKAIVIILSAKNETAIKQIEPLFNRGGRMYCHSLEEADSMSLEVVREYLS